MSGAGLAGLALAAALRKVGIPYQVLEQRGELSQEGAAIALWGNAMKALEQIGIADTIRAENTPLDTVRLCREDGRVLKQFGFDECAGGAPELVGVSRQRLQALLYEAADPQRVALDATVTSVSTGPAVHRHTPTASGDAHAHREQHASYSSKAAAAVMLEDGTAVRCKLLVGADGVRSAVGKHLGANKLNFVGQAGYRGIAHFDSDAPVAPRTVCQIFGAGLRAGMYPVSRTSVYWYVAFHDDGSTKQMTPEQRKAEAQSMVHGWQHGISECVAATAPEGISRNRFFDRLPLPAGDRLSNANITLAGDALHPMTPNLGQGGCVALEDAIVLAQVLNRGWRTAGDDLGPMLADYEKQRATRCLPLSIRSRGMGVVLQSGLPPVVAARDFIVSKLLDPGHFFDHTLFDVGKL